MKVRRHKGVSVTRNSIFEARIYYLAINALCIIL